MCETYQEVFSGPMSKTSRYRIYVSGDCGSKEITHMIRTLEIQRDFLAEDEAAAFIGPHKPEPALSEGSTL